MHLETHALQPPASPSSSMDSHDGREVDAHAPQPLPFASGICRGAWRRMPVLVTASSTDSRPAREPNLFITATMHRGFWEADVMKPKKTLRAPLESMVLLASYGSTMYFSRCLGIASRRPLL